MRLSKEEWKILGGLILIILVFSGLLFYDLNKKQSFGNRQIIGLITFKKNVVQRKFDSQVTWAQVEQNSPLANRDTVLSSDFSDAVIKLSDGTEIQVDENTMLYLEMSGKDANINFSDGSIKIKKGSSGDLKIKSKDTTIDVGKGDIKLEKSKDKDLNLFVNEGTATVNDGKSSKQIGKEQQAEFGKDGVNVKNIGLTLISPENQKTEYLSSRSVHFQWKKSNEIKSSSIEVSKRRDFSGKMKKISSENSSANVSLDDEGTYYWRVVGVNEKTNLKEFSETRKLTIYKKDELKLLSPSDGGVIYFTGESPKIDFNWKGSNREGGYKLQLSKSQNFSEILHSYDVKSNYFSLDNLREGKYFWRVSSKSVVGALEEKTSPRQFSVLKRTSFESPSLLSPKNNKEFSLNATAKNGVNLSWMHSSPEILKTLVQIAKDKKFSNVIQSQTVISNSYRLQGAIGEGEFFWRVKGISKTGKETNFSEMFSFRIEGKTQKDIRETKDSLNEEKDSSKNKKTDSEKKSKETSTLKAISPVNSEVDVAKDKAIKLKWTKQDGAKFYLVKIYDLQKKSGKPVFQEEVDSTSVTFTDLSLIEEGNFTWTVSAKKGDGDNLGKEIKSKFKIVAKSRLKNLKPSDIKFISPKTIYKEGQK